MQEKKEFNQLEYIAEYSKKNYKRFDTKLREREFNEIETILKKEKWSKADFLRESIKLYNKEKSK